MTAQGLLITHYTLIDENPYGCVFVLNDESAFMQRIKRQFGGVPGFMTDTWIDICQFIEETRHEDSDYIFQVADYSYVIYIHHYLLSFASIDT